MYSSLRDFRRSVVAGSVDTDYRPIVYPSLSLEGLRLTEWSPVFEKLMRNRLVMGALRYGRLHDNGKPRYDRVASIRKRLGVFERTRNKELLVDIANLCLLEFEEGEGLWEPQDDGEHVTAKERRT